MDKAEETINQLGEELKRQAKQPAVAITHAPKLPVEALMPAIAGSLCAKYGHNLLQGIGKIMRPYKGGPNYAGPEYQITDETIIFCQRCGASLQEIKGQ